MLQKADSDWLNCSLCGKKFIKSQSKIVPFCSVRCQQIDLGNWLSESYGLPTESDVDQPADSTSDYDSNEFEDFA